MADLFISYSSADRVWAERLFKELSVLLSINIFWDRDPAALPPGVAWNDYLETNARNAKHFAVFWSEQAKASAYVAAEIEMFRQNVLATPTKDGAARKLFYVPLEGQYGPLEATQGFAEFRRLNTYDPNAADRGISNLTRASDRVEWSRFVSTVRDTIIGAESTQGVSLAIVAMNSAITDVIDPMVNLKFNPADPSLQEVLTAVGLTLPAVKARYGPTALAWRPHDGAETVLDFMEARRAQIIATLRPEYAFHWEPWDLVATAMADPVVFKRRLDSLSAGPSVVVIDSISLHNIIVSNAFLELLEYAQNEQSVIVALSPIPAFPGLGPLYEALRARGKPVLNGYFEPQVPAKGMFARCGLNLQYPLEVDRLIRSSLGRHFRSKDPLVAGA